MRLPSGTADIYILIVIANQYDHCIINVLFSEEEKSGQLRIRKSDSAINFLCDFEPVHLNSECLSLIIC